MYIIIDMLAALAEGVVWFISTVLHMFFGLIKNRTKKEKLHKQPVIDSPIQKESWINHTNSFQPQHIFNWNYPILKTLYNRNKNITPKWPETIQWKKEK